MAIEGTHRYMKEHEHRYGAIIENHRLNGTNTITLMKHKPSTGMDGAHAVL